MENSANSIVNDTGKPHCSLGLKIADLIARSIRYNSWWLFPDKLLFHSFFMKTKFSGCPIFVRQAGARRSLGKAESNSKSGKFMLCPIQYISSSFRLSSIKILVQNAVHIRNIGCWGRCRHWVTKSFKKNLEIPFRQRVFKHWNLSTY